MSLNQLINLLVSVTLIEMMFAIGLSTSMNELVNVLKNWRLVAASLFANFICVPVVTVGLLMFLHARSLPSVGILVLAACPGASFGPPITAIAKGNLPLAVALMALLALSSVVIAPLILAVLTPLVAGNETVSFDTGKLIQVMLVTQMVPLSAGICLQHFLPSVAQQLQSWAKRVGVILNISALVMILLTHYSLFSEIPLRAITGMAGLLVSCLGIGWVSGGAAHDDRKTAALTTSLRNVGLGLVVVTGNFPGTSAVTAVLAYGLFEILGALLIAAWWGHGSLRMNRV